MIPLRWPLHPQPLEEEDLLSWLSRIACEYDLTLQEFLNYGLGVYGLTYESLDTGLSLNLMERIAERTNVSIAEIRAMSLRDPATLETKAIWKNITYECNELIALARIDLNIAFELRSFLLFGRTDQKSVQEIDSHLSDLGIVVNVTIT